MLSAVGVSLPLHCTAVDYCCRSDASAALSMPFCLFLIVMTSAQQAAAGVAFHDFLHLGHGHEVDVAVHGVL